MVITASGRAGEDEILTVNLDSEKQIQQEIIKEYTFAEARVDKRSERVIRTTDRSHGGQE